MNSRDLKIKIDVALVLTFIISLVTGNMSVVIHCIVGSGFTLLYVIHIFLNKKWIIFIGKNIASKKVNRKLKTQFFIDILLMLVWSIAIFFGVLAMINGNIENFSRLHRIFYIIGALLVFAHAAQHRKHIKSYLKKRKLNLALPDTRE